MKIKTVIPYLIIMIFMISCKKDKPESENYSKTNFQFGNNSYLSKQTNLYVTESGKIIETFSDDFQLFIILSDKTGTTFQIIDTLKADNQNAARCVLKIANDYYFSTAGTINLGADNNTGNMEISFENINLNEGKLIIDSVINGPYIDFTKISPTDLQGFPMNTGDEHDWIIRNDFQIVERLLLNEKSEFLYKEIKATGYPNPSGDVFHLEIESNQDDNVDLFQVNENFEIENKFIHLQYNNIALSLHNPEYQNNYYRIYYKIYTNSEKYYGSGDLKVIE